MLAYKFVRWEVPPLEILKDTREYILASKVEQGEQLTRKEKNEIAKMLRGVEQSFRLGGWCFPLRSLPTFYVEQYGSVYITKAPDKTSIRKTTHGKIERIVQRT